MSYVYALSDYDYLVNYVSYPAFNVAMATSTKIHFLPYKTQFSTGKFETHYVYWTFNDEVFCFLYLFKNMSIWPSFEWKTGFFLKRSVHGNLKTAIARLILDRLSSNLLCIFFIPRLSFFVLWLYQNHRYFTVYPKKTRKFDLALAKMTSLQKKRSDDYFIFSQKIMYRPYRFEKCKN